ncbi:MAG: hypothetical protein AAF810_18615 [Cyanobacteria bacterium P01_D01_bin.36]
MTIQSISTKTFSLGLATAVLAITLGTPHTAAREFSTRAPITAQQITAQQRRTPSRAPSRTVETVRPVITTPITTPTNIDGFAYEYSIVGNWQGTMNYAGDDVLVHFELNLNNNGQGNWKIHGSDYDPVNDEWNPVILQQGQLSHSIQNTNVAIQLSGLNSPMSLDGDLLNNGTKISGSVEETGQVFSFTKG